MPDMPDRGHPAHQQPHGQPNQLEWPSPADRTRPGVANYGGPVYQEPPGWGRQQRQSAPPHPHRQAPGNFSGDDRQPSSQFRDRGFGRGYGDDHSQNPSQSQRPGPGQGQGDWGTQPYYGGYGYDFQGQGFGGQAQGYPNPGFGSRRGAQRGPHAGKGPKRSDERIQDDVSRLLTEHGQIDASNVEVAAHDGEVTLSGTVDSRFAKRTAEDIAESVPGVKDVHNRLTIQRSGSDQSQPGSAQPPTQTVH